MNHNTNACKTVFIFHVCKVIQIPIFANAFIYMYNADLHVYVCAIMFDAALNAYSFQVQLITIHHDLHLAYWCKAIITR